MADRPPKKIGRAQSDREVQPLDERSVQFRGVLGVAQRLFESPRGADPHSSLDLDDAIVPTRLDDLAVQTSWPKDATDNSLVETESVSGDKGDTFKIHSTGYVLKESERVSVASSPYDSRPKPRPAVNRGPMKGDVKEQNPHRSQGRAGRRFLDSQPSRSFALP